MSYKNQIRKRSLRDANYDYFEAVTEEGVDVLDDYDETKYMDKDELVDFINDELFVNDSVTGNGSGFYWFNTQKSKECVLSGNNIDLLKEALNEFGSIDEFVEKFFDDDWEWMDVTIRCFVLGQVADKIADEYLAKRGA